MLNRSGRMTFAAKGQDMEYSSKKTRVAARCLHCGDHIEYGRTDRKFCSDECRFTHHNEEMRLSRAFRRRILSLLSSNYEILDELYRAGVTSIDMTDLMAAGFVPRVVTSCMRSGSHDEFGCFDIKYRMSATRVYSISKIQNVSLNLQAGNVRKKDR